MGSPGVNMSAGDLYVQIVVLPHNRITRIGKDLHLEHSISLKEAIHGGITEVLTLGGIWIQVSIPPGVQPGKTISVVRGAGLKNLKDNTKGNLYVTLYVTLPKVKTPRAHKLLEELELELSRNS
jgi:molecular chaperone DnaJ